MSINRTIFSDAEHQSLSIYSADMILACREKMKKLEILYKREKMVFPNHCRTNYRDSWFHYKKVYERFDCIKVYQEQYAMEEHLIRILKDAITVIFNEYAYRIENVYFLLDKKNEILDKLRDKRGDEYFKQFADISIDTDYWYYEINKRITGEAKIKKDIDPEKNEAITEVLVYLLLEQADIKSYRQALQYCMHLIKNYSLRIRLEGVEIYRPENNEDYLEDYADVFGKMKMVLEKYRIRVVFHRLSSFYENYID